MVKGNWERRGRYIAASLFMKFISNIYSGTGVNKESRREAKDTGEKGKTIRKGKEIFR